MLQSSSSIASPFLLTPLPPPIPPPRTNASQRTTPRTAVTSRWRATETPQQVINNATLACFASKPSGGTADRAIRSCSRDPVTDDFDYRV